MTIKDMITIKLEAMFAPQVLQVINESHRHQSSVDTESHFKVVLVCSRFSGQPRLERHRAVYQELKSLLKPLGPLHALSLHAYSELEWHQYNSAPPASPHCARSA